MDIRHHLTICLLSASGLANSAPPATQPELGHRSLTLITVDGFQFKDLNRNGRLDPYEDWRLRIDQRVENLLGQLTVEEKAGLMLHGTAPADAPFGRPALGYSVPAAKKLILGQHVNSFITRLELAPHLLAEQNNALQAIAETGRLGIPNTVSSDPRNHSSATLGAGNAPSGFSIWPEPLGLAASGDASLARQLGDTARQEYRAVGIHMALSPQADLFTEPRWPRGNGTFGEDADLVKAMVNAYVDGFQHGSQGVAADGVVTIVKHWVGYGASGNGFDGHNYYGRFSRIDDAALQLHIKPFEGAFAARVGGVMPTYNILEGVQINGKPIEQVGAGFSRALLTDVLRGKFGYDGLVLSDWAITEDCNQACMTGNPPQAPKDIGMPWGVEKLSRIQRFAKGVDAGLDQFGGVNDSAALLEAVRSGLLDEKRMDQSVRRILKIKFQLGLFENPYVQPARAGEIVNSPTFRAAADQAQRRSLVLLENRHAILPLKAKTKVYLQGVDRAAAERHGLIAVDDPAHADVAIIKLAAPFENLHPNHFFGSRQHEGNLAFKPGDIDYEKFSALSARLPTIAAIYLDRPAILTAIRDKAAAIVGDFGASTEALVAVLVGQANPNGRLPFALPMSMSAVEAQSPALPNDTQAPLYPLGHGLQY
jgi:beta-glucosidase